MYQTTNSILGQSETAYTAQTTATGTDSVLGRDAFLKLLITQLENQDPLNPMDDKEFTAQLAQFSSLEKLSDISETLEAMNENSARQDMLSAVSFIGKEVRAEGNSLSKEGSDVSVLYYDLPETAANVLVNVFDANGNLIHTVDLGGRQAGTYEFEWDGTNYQGATVEDGVYYVSMSAADVNGEPVLVSTDVSGQVSGVSTQDGTTYLRMKDGREVSLFDIVEVVNPQADNSAGDSSIGG